MRKMLSIFIIFGFVYGEKIKLMGKPQPIKITIVKKKEINYLLLKKDNPIVFEVEGPLFIRVYTRLIFEKLEKDTGYYKLILQQDEEMEKVISKKTIVSDVAISSDLRVGKWRSFLIDVPPGKHVYKIILWDSPLGNVAVRIKETEPPQWIEIAPIGSPTILTSIENEKIIKYYLSFPEKPLELVITGPKKIKIVVRINFTPQMGYSANFTLSVLVDGKETLRVPKRTYRSQIVSWREKKDVAPSKAEQFYVNIPEGTHNLSFKVLGTLAPSSCFRFLQLKRTTE